MKIYQTYIYLYLAIADHCGLIRTTYIQLLKIYFVLAIIYPLVSYNLYFELFQSTDL